jgi:hypothetical protein
VTEFRQIVFGSHFLQAHGFGRERYSIRLLLQIPSPDY